MVSVSFDRSRPLPFVSFVPGCGVRVFRRTFFPPSTGTRQKMGIAYRELGVNDHTDLVASLVVFRRHHRTVVTNVVETIRFDRAQAL